jgi:hypothetical protein
MKIYELQRAHRLFQDVECIGEVIEFTDGKVCVNYYNGNISTYDSIGIFLMVVNRSNEHCLGSSEKETRLVQIFDYDKYRVEEPRRRRACEHYGCSQCKE